MRSLISVLLLLAATHQILGSAVYYKPKPDVIVCPDKTECPTASKCCPKWDKTYFCCDFVNGVCCLDYMDYHCCQQGLTCGWKTCDAPKPNLPWLRGKHSMSLGVCCTDSRDYHCCQQGLTCGWKTCDAHKPEIPWLGGKHSKSLKPLPNIVCPDGKSECPDGDTCCKLTTGAYGCCPLPKAVCCSDHEHCCPNGTTCDVAQGKCNRGNIKIDWFSKRNALPSQKPSPNIICPDGKSQCPDGDTCCKLTSGAYGCCPLPKAVCCSDHLHCCPNGTTCDVAQGKCNRGNLKIDWFSKREASNIQKPNIVCPDGKSQCPDGDTCCKLTSGAYGCCPLPKAVCCSDHLHCCPNGTTCDVAQGKCIRGNTQIDWFSKRGATPINKPAIVCPDGKSQCPDGDTCCKLTSGAYGCCPLPKAVCCSDHLHCCPNGTTCDVAQGKCIRGNTQIDWFSKRGATPINKPAIVCPDGKSQCPDGDTCCKLTSGAYGCCPLPKAVCCSDHLHCCPNGTTCDVAQGKCIRGNLQIDWFTKRNAKSINKPQIVCPDGKSQCPDGDTCCKLTSGAYGCCPLPKAVCCSDHLHCCPNGTTCDVAQGKCIRGNLMIDWFAKRKAIPRQKAVEDVVCPDGKSECPDGDTCCKLTSGAYGCCPLPNAVCCSDHLHCCPHGTTCDVAQGKCNRGNIMIDWFSKRRGFPIKKTLDNVICPGGESECPDGTTCCKLSSGQYGCCPLPNAICCSDHVHCCPQGMTCQGSFCVKGDVAIDWFSKTKALQFKKTLDNVICPDGESECPDGNTCCKLSSGKYGCCPLPNAVCCSDHLHCCPQGMTCEVSHCKRGDVKIDWFTKTKALPTEKAVNVVCPGGESQCPDGNTCCKLRTGGYGCCPIPNAVCCSDHVHCCPSGTTCDVAAGKCKKGDLVIDWFPKTKTIKSENSVNVVCPGGQSQCPDGHTCCKLSTGQYGCCPIPNAVCCSDHLHCCPSGTTCDVTAGKCKKGGLSIDWVLKTKAIKTEKAVNVVCPGGQSQCPDGSTCCKLSSGGYGCCPLPNAVCCSDHLHCCPSGTTCDVAAGKCSKGGLTVDWFLKTKALYTEEAVNVVCPGGKSQCPAGTTCCKLSSGQYGCCSIPNAVCCSDHLHCCPSGTTCDVAAGKCKKGDLAIDWFLKTEALNTERAVNVVCPGGQSQCPKGTTCCKLSSGQYGCCPIPNAVCCSDHLHCCPSGTTCDVAAGKCKKGDLAIDWFFKTEALTTERVTDVICPGGQYRCPDGTTCCKLTSGQYGCCPIPNAVCCSDHQHCCPSGTTCDVAAGKCNRGDLAIDWFLKTEALNTERAVNVVCPGGQSQCPKGTTCCKLSSGQYGCCPIPNAVCCSDHLHCCPNGTTCDVTAGKCKKGDVAIDWFLKTEALNTERAVNVVCPGGQSQCPKGTTCCKLSSGQYGCCPIPNAVCCSDHLHCCPNGTTCDVTAGKCKKGDLAIDWFLKTEALNTERAVNVVCPGGQSQCPKGTTCCKLSSGQYGCCPIPNAVCCSDHLHCCPNGTTCDVTAGKCKKGDLAIDWFLKTEALNTERAVNVVCPGGQSQCPKGTTCCKLSSGQYGCCPIPNAVCCSDHLHCCPSGTTCDVAAGKCKKGDLAIDWFDKTEALNTEMSETVTCPDKKSQCPNGSTCCKLSTSQYGCCPLPKAVCCNDGTHCCPHGSLCDVAAGKCNKQGLVIDWFEKTQALTTENIRCKDRRTNCSSSSTCCRTPRGYGCCPMVGAVCCDDLVHCCPPGTTCDSALGKCALGTTKTDWVPHLTISSNLKDVICPDQIHECPDGSTCCLLKSGSWGCCPLPDRFKTCTTCDSALGKCALGTSKTDWVPHLTISSNLKDVICPDQIHECPDGSTCCLLKSGSWGCCPLPDAVCCNDGKHCCPKMYICDIRRRKCKKQNHPESDIELFLIKLHSP